MQKEHKNFWSINIRPLIFFCLFLCLCNIAFSMILFLCLHIVPPVKSRIFKKEKNELFNTATLYITRTVIKWSAFISITLLMIVICVRRFCEEKQPRNSFFFFDAFIYLCFSIHVEIWKIKTKIRVMFWSDIFFFQIREDIFIS